jgi:hypothetical protein
MVFLREIGIGQNVWDFFQNLSPATALKTLNRFSLEQVKFQIIDTCLEGSIQTLSPPHRVLLSFQIPKKIKINKNRRNVVIHNAK